MKLYLKLFFLSFFIAFIAGCSGNKTVEKKSDTLAVSVKPVLPAGETAILLKYLEANGNYIRSREFPSLIKASIVNEELDNNIHIIDMRTPSEFKAGHIKGAVNKRFEDLYTYLQTGIKPFEYDKIIIVSADGQIAGYTASLLQLMGYGNVYSIRWGMSAWNKQYASEGWLKGVSGKYEAKLELKDNEKPLPKNFPTINTGKSTGEEIADARFRKLISEGTENILITADEVFKNPQDYFIINLERKDKYDDGHIPGAVRYKPDATLGFLDEMATLPPDRIIVVYCGTGHNSSFATAYLRFLGYDARTLKYGNNGFMYDKMIKQKTALSWLPFSTSEVNDFKVVK